MVGALPLLGRPHGWTAPRRIRPRELRSRYRSQLVRPVFELDREPAHADSPSVSTSKPIAPFRGSLRPREGKRFRGDCKHADFACGQRGSFAEKNEYGISSVTKDRFVDVRRRDEGVASYVCDRSSAVAFRSRMTRVARVRLFPDSVKLVSKQQADYPSAHAGVLRSDVAPPDLRCTRR